MGSNNLDHSHQAHIHDENALKILPQVRNEGPLSEGLPRPWQHLSAYHYAIQQALHGGCRVLDFGCGMGELTIILARQDKIVNAFDISSASVKVTNQRAVNASVNNNALVADAGHLPYKNESFNVVIGLAVLHHLPPQIMSAALSETKRVLAQGGIAIFVEPIENSRIWDWLQQLFPAGSPSTNRPSIINYPAWKQWKRQEHDRSLTIKELRSAATSSGFDIEIREFGLSNRIDNWFTGPFALNLANKVDNILLRFFPPLRRFARNAVVMMKAPEIS